MANTIQVKRGVEASIPALADGEPGWCTDTFKLFVGQGGVNKLVGEASFLKLSGGTLTGLLTLSGDPSSALHAATKQYVDGLVQGIDAKASVKAATTANITPSGTQTIDGIALSVDDRCLVKNQTTASQNGIYLVKAAAWQRTSDADSWNELVSLYAWVEQGTTNGDSGWLSTVDAGGTLGTTAVTFVQFSGAGQITAGAGLTKTGNTIDVGAGTGITVAADSVSHTAHTGDVTGATALTIANKQTLTASNGVNISNSPIVIAGAAPAISLTYGAAANTVCQGNDARLHTQHTDIGTSNPTFQVGTGGPLLKLNTGTRLDLRTYNDATYADITIKDLRMYHDASAYYVWFYEAAALTANRQIKYPDASGTMILDTSTIDGGVF